jgi:hypothetical protein
MMVLRAVQSLKARFRISKHHKEHAMTLKKYGAWAGIAFPILQMASQGLVQVGGMEPAFAAPAAEILTFFQNRTPALAKLGGFLSILSAVVFIWFAAALWDEIRAIEGGSGWVSAIALGSGFLFAAAIFEPGGWELALFRLEDGLDPQMARTLFDEGNLNFANMWVALGSLLLASGLVLKNGGSYPAWMGWYAVILAVGMFAARYFWTTSAAFIPYVLFWLWMIVMGIMMARRVNPEG